MSQSQRRSRHGGTAARTQPLILKAKKRKNSENALESSKIPCLEGVKMANGSVTSKPLDDVTSTSLNVERERPITPETMSEDWHRFRGLTCYPTPTSKRKVPLPSLTWADRDKVWEFMCRKDHVYKKNPQYLRNHTALQPRMRAILLDWLTEVCEVYKLHRETYYLATDYIDRYLTATSDVPKQQLQLIGITCLFVAAKIEEIYPPKLGEFSYVTDGACTDEEILDKELVILKTLNWDLTPVTSNCWLNTFLQLLHQYLQDEPLDDLQEPLDDPATATDFIFPHYSGLTFVQLARHLDLCTLDITSLNFPSSKLAATALCYLANTKLAATVSGYSVEEMQECSDWMGAFAITVQEKGPASLKMFNQVPADDVHNIQTHAVDLEMLERAQVRLNQLNKLRLSPPINATPVDALTPPKTDEKSNK